MHQHIAVKTAFLGTSNQKIFSFLKIGEIRVEAKNDMVTAAVATEGPW